MADAWTITAAVSGVIGVATTAIVAIGDSRRRRRDGQPILEPIVHTSRSLGLVRLRLAKPPRDFIWRIRNIRSLNPDVALLMVASRDIPVTPAEPLLEVEWPLTVGLTLGPADRTFYVQFDPESRARSADVRVEMHRDGGGKSSLRVRVPRPPRSTS